MKREKRKFFPSKYGLIIIVVLLSIFVGGKVFQIEYTKKNENLESKLNFGQLLNKEVRTTPTISLPSPTPTLTPQQIAEIQRKKFEEWNSKYGPCKWVPILMYHHVLDSSVAKEISATNLNVPINTFREQMDYLLGKGYHVISLDEMMAGIRSNSLPSKPVVLTFDDGYRDFYENVFPILREKSIRATVFAISQFVGGPRYVEWWQIREMVGSNLVLVGDHTLNHPSVLKLSVDEERNQIVSARKILEENTGQKVEFFAYPYGSYNSAAEQILKENGFIGAVVTTNVNPQCSGLPYELSRIRIGAGSLSRYGL